MSLRPSALGLSLALLLSVAGTRAFAEDLHEVIATPAKATAGGSGTVSVTLAAKNGWKLNDQAPMSLKLTPGAGLTVEKAKLGRKDAAEQSKDRARFEVPFAASEAGQKAIDCEASYVICQESACKQIKEKVALAVDVAPAAASKKKK